MKRIIVTGATSMIGTALIESAITHDTEIYALVRKNTGRLSRLPVSDKIHIIECELDELENLKLPEKCDVFYHFAWAHTSKYERNDPKLQITNIAFTMSAVKAAQRAGCTKFIGAGSQAEYGPVKGIIDMNTRFCPTTAYGIAKLSAGMLSRKECDNLGMIHIWCRIFSVYGKNDNEGTMIDYAVRSFLKHEPANFSSGIQKWDYLNERDAGNIFLLLGEKVNESIDFRVASGYSQPLKNFILTISERTDSNDLCRFALPKVSDPPFDLEVDTSDLENAINYRPQISFEDGIEKIIDYYKKIGV